MGSENCSSQAAIVCIVAVWCSAEVDWTGCAVGAGVGCADEAPAMPYLHNWNNRDREDELQRSTTATSHQCGCSRSSDLAEFSAIVRICPALSGGGIVDSSSSLIPA